jgi:hypothetical protein
MPKYAINMRFVYEPTFIVEASSQKEAWDLLREEPRKTFPSIFRGRESTAVNGSAGEWREMLMLGAPVLLVTKAVARTTKPKKGAE